MRYLLDANAVIDLLNDPNSKLGRRVRSHKPSDISISAVVIYELFYGAYKSARLEHNLVIIDNLPLEVIDFDKEDARHAGQIRATLAKKGKPIGPYDVLIAGQAKARNMVLVTRNTDEFKRVQGLLVEDWGT